jgi:hypothetical protein
MDDDAARRLLDLEEIKQLKARYFRLLDAKDWVAWTDVFTDDLEFVYVDPSVQNVPPDALRLPDGRAQVDRRQLVAFVSESMRHVLTIHHGHMPEIDLVDADTAAGHWGLTNYCEYTASDGALRWLRGYGHYDDRYVRTPAGWRIRRSEFYRRDMVEPPPRPLA